ncbi:prolipoprotein diacylglyceryl transferase [Aerococcaceae bacterium NML190938]|nr:prolipoprotein diacylglyceryl transferase [Aerococcaceae bacterium NML190938]
MDIDNMLATIHPTAFHLFGWPVQWYGIIIGLAMIVGYQMVMRRARQLQINDETMADIIFWTIVCGLIGARAYYVLFKWDYYAQNPEQIIQVWHGGLAIYGGILAGVAALVWLCRRYRQDVWQILDIAAPAVMLAQAIGRWGNFINQEAYGGVTTQQFLQSLHLPTFIIEQMYIDGHYYHPTFLYESLWNLIGACCLIFVRKQENWWRSGEIAALYLIWYGFGRFFIEGLRSDSLYLGAFRISQVVSIVSVVMGVAYILYQRTSKKEVSK